MATCANNKVDSNETGLSVAEEICAKQLPTIDDDGYLPTWFELEPNTYDDFGGSYEKMARSPINRGRQNRKGVTVDLDATGGFNTDQTKSNMQRLLQGFFFADIRQKVTTKPINGAQIEITAATLTTNTYTAAAGLAPFKVGQLILVSGFLFAANNGLSRITAVSDTAITVNKALAAETGTDDVVISVVGVELGAAAAAWQVSGEIPTLHLSAVPVAATGVITITVSQNVSAADTVTIGGEVYTFVVAPADAPYEVPIGADRAASGANLAIVINGGQALTPKNTLVSAVNASGVVTLTALVKGLYGNTITLAKVGTNLTVSGANLTGGTNYSWNQLGAVVGEWLFIGDDGGFAFADNAPGYARIKAITDQDVTFDKTTWLPTAEAATGITLRIFVGDVIKNESDPDLIKTRYWQFQRTLGKDASGLTQAEYLEGSVASEMTVNIETADKVNIDLSYIAADHTTRTGAEGLKEGDLIRVEGEDAFSTSTSPWRMKIAINDPATSFPTNLIGYCESATITINNNVSAVKAVAALGGIDVSVGNFDAGGSITALFQNVLAIRAVRNNSDVTFDAIFAQDNYGLLYDIPLLALGDGLLDVAPGDPITMPLSQEGAECDAGYTMLFEAFKYLPTIAMPD